MEPRHWHVRDLRTSDADAAAALIRAAFADQGIVTDPLPSALRETAEGVAAMQGGAVAVADDFALVGVVLWGPRDGGLYIGRLSVAPGWRRQGIAHGLVDAAETAARARGMPVMRLSTRLPLSHNRRLFAACGFVETGQTAHAGYDHPTCVDMEKRLG